MDRPVVRQVQEGSGEQRTTEESGCEVICGVPTTLAVKGSIGEGEGVKVMALLKTISQLGYHGCRN